MSSLNRTVAIFNDVKREVVSAAIADVLAELSASVKTLTRMMMREIVIINSMSVNPSLERKVVSLRYNICNSTRV